MKPYRTFKLKTRLVSDGGLRLQYYVEANESDTFKLIYSNDGVVGKTETHTLESINKALKNPDRNYSTIEVTDAN